MGTDLTPAPLPQNVPQIELSRKQIKAARLLAEGELTQTVIAQQLGLNRRTLLRWMQEPEYSAFQAKLSEFRQRYAAVVMSSGLARRERRVQHLTDLHQRLRAVIKERAKDPTMQGVPGGKTGVLVRKIKSLEVDETYKDADGNTRKRTVKKVIPEYETDVGTTSELRRIQEQIAIEVGDREPEEGAASQPMTAIAISIKYDQPAPKAEAFIELPRIEIKHDGHEPKNGDGQ
jgi:predicted DNA-binding protein (UPF0251 family)